MVTSTAQELLAAATEALDGQSAAGLKVDEVARRAGINKRMIYHHFGNKAGLVGAVRGAQAALLCRSIEVSATTRDVLLRWYPSASTLDEALLSAHLERAHRRRAARVVLAGLLEALGRDDDVFNDIEATQWRALLAELGGLACRGEALSLAPDSKQSLTVKGSKNKAKPSFRLASVSRPKGPAGS